MAEEREPGLPDSTATRTALWRALHVAIDAPPHILEDTIGIRLVEPEDGWRERPDMDPERTATNRASIVARQRATEDALADSGAGQYVVLGAGLDTFAQRDGSDVQVFEIDAPATQAWKRARLADLGLLADARVAYVPVDFEAGSSWSEALTGAGFDPAAPAFVSLLGVTMYLTRDAIAATFREAASLGEGTTLAFTFSRPVEMAPAEVRPILEIAMKGAAESGHPWHSLLTPDEARTLALEAGFAEAEVLTSTDLHDRYFSGRDDQLSPIGGEDLVVARR